MTNHQQPLTADQQLSFMDHLPSNQSGRIREIIADCSSTELFRVQRGRQAAMDMSWTFGANSSSHTAYMFTDAQRGANQTGYAFLHSLADAARKREDQLRMAWCAGDDSVNIGVSRTASQDAYQEHRRGLSEAWKGAPAAVSPSNTADAANSAPMDSRTAYEQMCIDQSNAWKMGK